MSALRLEVDLFAHMRFDPLGLLLAVLAAIASHLALLAEILRVEGPSGWQLAAMVVAANLTLGVAMGLALGFRRIPLLAVLATAALTEALLWQPANRVENEDWIATVAALGLAGFVGCWLAVRWAERRYGSRR